MTNKELKATIDQCRYWINEPEGVVPFPLSDHLRVITDELEKRVDAEESRESE